MQPCISHFSAFRILKRMRNDHPAQRSIEGPCAAPRYVPSRRFMQAACCNFAEGMPVDVLVSQANGKRNDAFTRSHLCAPTLPEGSLVHIVLPDGTPALCVSPELLFIELADSLTFQQIVYVGFSLCSHYRIDKDAPGGIAHREHDDEPLTCVSSINQYLSEAGGMRGVARARRAIRFVHDGSRSPMESALAMGYGLPVRYGGFACGNIELNKPTTLYDGTDLGRRSYSRRIPDLTITATGRDRITRQVYLDYDADSVHASRRGLAKDSARRNQIATMASATHLSMTSAQALEFGAYSRVADQIRIALKRQNPVRISLNAQDPASVAQLERIHQRRVSLWQDIVCYSEFRKRE